MKTAIRSGLTIGIAAALVMPSAHAQDAGDRTRVLQAAAYALGMARWSDIGVSGSQLVRDVWQQRDLGTFTDQFSAKVPAHGAMLIKVSPRRYAVEWHADLMNDHCCGL